MATLTERRMFPQRDEDNDSPFKSMKSDATIAGDDDFKTSGERRHFEMGENVPLKPSATHNQQGFFSSADFGLKMIILAFFVVSFAITIALIVQIFSEEAHPTFSPGTVVSDSEECSKLGLKLLQKGGSAVDAVVCTQLCLGVVHPHVTGLGGGGFMLIHNHGKTKKTFALNFRETAPEDSSQPIDVTKPVTTIGVPGLLHGLYTAHTMAGKLKWKDVVRPVAEFARNGFEISSYLAEALERILPQWPEIRALFPNISLSGNRLVGQKVKQKKLAKILDLIAEHGPDVFYKGGTLLGVVVVETLLRQGGHLQPDDFANYTTIVSEPLTLHWKDKYVLTMDHPSSGPHLLSALKGLENLTLTNNSSMTEFVITVLQASEAAAMEKTIVLNVTDEFMKNLTETTTTVSSVPYAQLREDMASSVVAVDGQELFVTLISGLGSLFGSRVVADGIVLNDALFNFATPNQEKETTNISLGRPPSTMTPAIVYDSKMTCGLRLAAGAASSQLLLEVLIQKLIAQKSVKESVEATRFYVSFNDKHIFEEHNHRPALNNDTEAYVSGAGYILAEVLPPYISINMVAMTGDTTESHADSRGGGDSSLT